jgi:hypothetical protein
LVAFFAVFLATDFFFVKTDRFFVFVAMHTLSRLEVKQNGPALNYLSGLQ